MAPSESTPLLGSSELITPQSFENDTHTATMLRRSSIMLSEFDEDFPPEGYIFTEVIQSPFEWFSDKGVFAVRVVVAILMSAALGGYWWLECQKGDGMIFWFRLGNLVWAGQTFYMWLVAIWSLICIAGEPSLPYTNQNYPSTFRDRLLSTLARSHILTFLFRTFYTLITTLPFPATLFYLFVVLPNPQSPAHPTVLLELAINTIPSVIAFFEIFVFASVGPVPGRRCTYHLEQGVAVVLVVLGYCTLWVKLWETFSGQEGETDWRLLGGWRKEREVVAVEMACVIGAYFYAIVEFVHCCKYYCLL